MLFKAPTPPPPTNPCRYFIADLHLDGLDTPRALQFRELLRRISVEAGARPVELYILGDLFEFWYEYRKALFDIYRADLQALETAAKAGVRIFLLFGNRDFAYGQYVKRRLKAGVLGDGGAITLNDSRPVWLEHGDLLCSSDRRYLKFRAMIRSWPIRLVFWLMPWACARRMIERIRRRTSADKARKDQRVLEIDRHAARLRLEQTGCRVLLCGHTHCPMTEDLGAGYRLIVLPPWCEHPSGFMDDGKVLKPFTL